MSDNKDAALSVTFFLKPTQNMRASKEAARPIFDEIEMVSIAAPGNTKTQHTARADRLHWDGNRREQISYIDRFSEEYRRFKQGLEAQGGGTPIEELASLSMTQKAEMRAAKITTVEQLARMSDANIRKMGPGFRAYVDQAKAYLDVASGAGALAAEMAAMRAELDALRAQGAKPAEAPSAWAHFEDQDLRNMLTDAGVKVDGRWGRDRLEQEMHALQDAAVA